MPWFPDFVSAVELARRQTRSVGLADPVQRYFDALETGRTNELEEIWPGEVVIYDPREGEVRGHRQLRRFVRNNQSLWAERHARIETVASTSIAGRAVVELLAHLDDYDGQPVDWPIAVVAEFPEELSVVFRTYCSQWPVDGQHHIRPPALEPGNSQLSDVVGRYLAALSAGDLDSVVSAFAPDAYFRESIGPHYLHHGRRELRSYFADCFKAGGGLKLEHCTVNRRRRALRPGIQLCQMGQS
jgi:ketosteroid isomerase-like protein